MIMIDSDIHEMIGVCVCVSYVFLLWFDVLISCVSCHACVAHVYVLLSCTSGYRFVYT